MDNHASDLPSVTQIAGGVPDATARLEPLAVPLARFGGILRRHYLVLLLTMLLGVGGTAMIVTAMPKQYTAEATLLIEPRRTQVSDLQAISPDPGDVTSLIRTQMDILNSPSLLMKVVKSLDLQNNPTFMHSGASPLAGPMLLLHRVISLKESPVVPLSAQQQIELAAGILAGKIGFANELRSSVLHVQVTTQSATLSANIANEIARQFLEFKRQEKFSAMQRADDWLQAQLGGLADQVHAAETAVEQYRAQHGLIDLPDDGTSGAAHPTSVLRQQLDQVASELTQASRDVAQKVAKLSQAQDAMSHHDLSSLPDVLMSPVVTELLAQEATMAGRAAQLAASEGPRNPEMVATYAALHRVQGHIAAQMANIVQSLHTEVQSARAQQTALQERLEALRQEVGQENSAELGLQGLHAKAHATRSLYDSFLTRATELANVAGIQEPDAALVSNATPPLGPSAPQRTRFVAVAGILSCVLGVGLACLIERLRAGFGSPEQLEACLGARTIGLIPSVPAKAQEPAAKGRAAVRFGASLDNVRGYLHAMGEARPKVIMVTSALPREGKSVLASSLAVNAARAGWRVLLLECDFRRPILARRFGLPASAGLSDVLIGGLLGSSISLLHEVQPRLHVLPAGRAPADPQELLASSRMTRLLAAFRNQYDLVILDTPPVIPVADGLILSRRVDATLMVVRWEKTPRMVVQDAASLLRRSRAVLMGTVMTRADLRRAARSGGRPTSVYDYGRSYHAMRI